MYSFPKSNPICYALMAKSVIRIFLVIFSFFIAGQVFSQNVGIGTNTPSQKLEVDGNMEVTSGRILFSNIADGIYIGTSAGQNDNSSFRNNIFIGNNSGTANTTGQINTALGAFALASNTSGNFNTAIGGSALQSATGGFNVAVGYNAGLLTTGTQNTFLGNNAGYLNMGSRNIFLGYNAGREETGSDKLYIDNSDTSTPLLFGEFDKNKLTINDTLVTKQIYLTDGAADGYLLKSNSSGKGSWVNPTTLFNNVWSISGNNIYKNNSGNVGIGVTSPLDKLHVVGNLRVDAGRIAFANIGYSIFIGENAGLNDDLSNSNVLIGLNAGKNNIAGENNIVIGTSSLDETSHAVNNIAIGNNVLGSSGLTGNNNIGMGYYALFNNTTGFENIAIGQNALVANTGGVGNISLGNLALTSNLLGNGNVAIGNSSLLSTNGHSNTAVGHAAGTATTGIENTFLGYAAGWANNGSANVFIGHKAGFNEMGSNKLYIENSGSSTPLIYGEFDNDEVGINTSTPASTFEIAGTMGAKIKNSQIAGENQPDGTALIWRYTSIAGAITLPSASSCPNRMYMILNQSMNSMSISTYTNLANTSVGSIASLSSILLISDGSGWFQIQ